MDPGLPAITKSDAFMTPFVCRTWGCFAVAEWSDGDRTAMTVGFCGRHRTYIATVRVHVHGREGQGWDRWPMTLVKFLALRDRGELP